MNKKIYRNALLIGSILLGILLHSVFVEGGYTISFFNDINWNSLTSLVPVLLLVISLGLFIWMLWYFIRIVNFSKKRIEDIEQVDEMYLLSFHRFSWITPISLVIFPFLSTIQRREHFFLFVPVCLAFIGSIVLSIKGSKFCLNQIKQLNPEKRGDLDTLDFDRQWLASCDEAEKWKIYQAGYQSYQILNKVLLALWVILLLGFMFFRLSFLLLNFVSILNLISFGIHLQQAKKIEKRWL